ncbi:E3 ubiquitin-protein ligase HECW2-like isoform X2 [Watersipora subatra]|uniref:E3 ubiquitin-protein ligase HECW2-like isoform X2 n=1 Tax=Watersipora subatra TaxID=2589382 RepID=UPI00355BA2A9
MDNNSVSSIPQVAVNLSESPPHTVENRGKIQIEAVESTPHALSSVDSDELDITRSFSDPFALYQLEEGDVDIQTARSVQECHDQDDINGGVTLDDSDTIASEDFSSLARDVAIPQLTSSNYAEGSSPSNVLTSRDNTDSVVKASDTNQAESNSSCTASADAYAMRDKARDTQKVSESETTQAQVKSCDDLAIDMQYAENTHGSEEMKGREKVKDESSVSSNSTDGTLITSSLENPPVPRHSILRACGENSASVWSLENHAGSQENIFEEEVSTAERDYQNLSDLVSKVLPATPEVDCHAKDKPPLPLPRMKNKTLAEQLQNLPVIESEAFHRHSTPPDLPQKTSTKQLTKSTNPDLASKRRNFESEESLEMPPGQAPVPPDGARMEVPSGQAPAPVSLDCTQLEVPSNQVPAHSDGARLEMPSGQAPVPPDGARPKRSAANYQQQVAAQYEAVQDMADAIPKKVATKEEPPLLQPRKVRTELPPPRLPPRKTKTGVPNSSQAHNDLDEVFEPSLSSRQHAPRHHKTKGTSRVAPGTESEEARVAAEVANAAASLPRPNRMKSESIEVEEALPDGWEARVDAHGRVFYIDHNNRSTTWERPTNSNKGPTAHHASLQRVPSISNTDRVNMDNRYRIVKRMSSIDTINEASSPPRHHAPLPPSASRSPTSQPPSSFPEHQASAATEGPASNPPVIEGATASTTSTSQSKLTNPPAASALDAETRLKQEIIRNSPAVKFLTRTDFFSLVQYSDEAQTCYTGNSALKHMVHKIRKDPMTFHKYWHNKDLVNFLNMFVNKEEELPGSWQMKHDKTGKVFFLDHNTKTTTFIDPRLPTVQPALNPGSQLPLPRSKYRVEDGGDTAEGASNLPTAYDEKVVIFLRQPNVLALLQDKYPLLKKNESLKNKINTVISDGCPALKKYRNHVELTIVLSMFENEIMSYVPAYLRNQHEPHQTSPKGSPAPARRMEAPVYKRDFQDKYRTFLRKIEAKGIGQGPGKTKMRVRRDHILEDSFKKIMSYSKKDLQKNKLLISFLGEEGLDYGGPAREFFFLLSRELFNPYYGLFEYSANDTYTVQISSMSTFVDNAAEWFRFAGRMIGLCIVHQYLMDSFFTRPFYKMLLREPCVLSDLESLDAEFHRSLLWIKDNDISEAGLDLTFSVDEEVFGQVTERELKPNGMNIPVTNRNKKEYIDKMVSWRIDRGVNEQKEHLLKGFHEVIEPKLVSIFDAKDLELVIAGTAEIDIVDWRNNTDYRSGYYDTHPLVDWFWQVIERFDNEKRLRLLQFVTGTSSIPFEGFSALRGSNGPRKFTIEKWGTPDSLPRAHTCFNRLDLPTYTSRETMQEKLMLAISETSTFGIE